jgi:hypothetical protein
MATKGPEKKLRPSEEAIDDLQKIVCLVARL